MDETVSQFGAMDSVVDIIGVSPVGAAVVDMPEGDSGLMSATSSSATPSTW